MTMKIFRGGRRYKGILKFDKVSKEEFEQDRRQREQEFRQELGEIRSRWLAEGFVNGLISIKTVEEVCKLIKDAKTTEAEDLFKKARAGRGNERYDNPEHTLFAFTSAQELWETAGRDGFGACLENARDEVRHNLEQIGERLSVDDKSLIQTMVRESSPDSWLEFNSWQDRERYGKIRRNVTSLPDFKRLKVMVEGIGGPDGYSGDGNNTW